MTDDEGNRIITVAEARAAIREADSRHVPSSFMILIDPMMRPRKLIALLFIGKEQAGMVLADNFPAIAKMMPDEMRHSSRRHDDPPYVLGYWTNADPGPTVH